MDFSVFRFTFFPLSKLFTKILVLNYSIRDTHTKTNSNSMATRWLYDRITTWTATHFIVFLKVQLFLYLIVFRSILYKIDKKKLIHIKFQWNGYGEWLGWILFVPYVVFLSTFFFRLLLLYFGVYVTLQWVQKHGKLTIWFEMPYCSH